MSFSTTIHLYPSLISGSSKDDPLLRATDTLLANKVIFSVALASLDADPLKKHDGKP